MSTQTHTQDRNDLCRVLSFAAEDSCLHPPYCVEGDPCITCMARRLLEQHMPRMTVQEAVAIIKADLLPEENRHWRDSGCPHNHHYLALCKLIEVAEAVSADTVSAPEETVT